MKKLLIAAALLATPSLAYAADAAQAPCCRDKMKAEGKDCCADKPAKPATAPMDHSKH